MIVYQGIKTRNKLYMLCFSNDKQSHIEIPIDAATAKRIAAYLEGFSEISSIVAVERGNDESSEKE